MPESDEVRWMETNAQSKLKYKITKIKSINGRSFVSRNEEAKWKTINYSFVSLAFGRRLSMPSKCCHVSFLAHSEVQVNNLPIKYNRLVGQNTASRLLVCCFHFCLAVRIEWIQIGRPSRTACNGRWLDKRWKLLWLDNWAIVA